MSYTHINVNVISLIQTGLARVGEPLYKILLSISPKTLNEKI